MSHPSSLIPHSPEAPLALLGGTFDPPHVGHLFLAECARHQFNARQILFLPAGDPYKKSGSLRAAGSGLGAPSAAEHRLAMVRLAAADNPHFAVDARETSRGGPTYTVDTLEELRREGHANLLLILGEDTLNDLPTWKRPDRILELAAIAVAPKPWQGAPAMGEVPFLIPHSSFLHVTMPPLPISSTFIRQRAAAGEPIRYLVPRAVEQYIANHNLYQALSPEP